MDSFSFPYLITLCIISTIFEGICFSDGIFSKAVKIISKLDTKKVCFLYGIPAIVIKKYAPELASLSQ